MILKKEVKKENFYKLYYTALNGILDLSNKQLEVLAELSKLRNSLPDTFTEEQKDEYTFNSISRGIICNNLGISIYNLNNFIKALRDKGFIISKGETYSLNKMIYFPLKENEYEITFKFKID